MSNPSGTASNASTGECICRHHDVPSTTLRPHDGNAKYDKKSSSSRRQRSLTEQCRWLILRGRYGESRAVLQGIVIVSLFLLSYQVYSHSFQTLQRIRRSILFNVKGRQLLAQAGYNAKPPMVALQFRDQDSNGRLLKVKRITPPESPRQWRSILSEWDTENRQIRYPMSKLSHQKAIEEDSSSYADEQPNPMPYPDVCRPQYKWQADPSPVCNVIHEVASSGPRLLVWSNDKLPMRQAPTTRNNMRRKLEESKAQPESGDKSSSSPVQDPPADMKYLASGHWRDTWRLHLTFGRNSTRSTKDALPSLSHEETLALKTPKYERPISERVLDKQRRDAITSDRLTHSEQSIKMYAYCGLSAIYEYAPGGDLHHYILENYTPEEWTTTWSSWQRLQLAWNATSALTDLHYTGTSSEYPAIVHGDFKAKQFVGVAPKSETNLHDRLPHFKLGDFNLAQMLYWNALVNETCPINIEGTSGHFRGPDEFSYKKTKGLATEKMDVYSLGNMLYMVLTGREPFDDVQDSKELKRKVLQGDRPDIEPKFLELAKSDQNTHAMITAIQMCWKHDPKKRASSRDVEQFLAPFLKGK